MAKVTKKLNAINLGSKYSQVISNTNINVVRDPSLTNI